MSNTNSTMPSSTYGPYPQPPPPYNPTAEAIPPEQYDKQSPPVYQPQGQNPNYGTTPPIQIPIREPTIIVGIPVYGIGPTTVNCANCHQTVVSNVSYRPGLLTWLLVFGLFLFGCGFGCCLIPLCVDGCQDVEHYCPNCKTLLGTYKRI